MKAENKIIIILIVINTILTTGTSFPIMHNSSNVAFGQGLQQQQPQQYANGITNSTSTVCIDDKCVTTICVNNQPCRTLQSNSTTIPDNSTANKDNTTISPIPLETI
jgi:hypothetical protein